MPAFLLQMTARTPSSDSAVLRDKLHQTNQCTDEAQPNFSTNQRSRSTTNTRCRRRRPTGTFGSMYGTVSHYGDLAVGNESVADFFGHVVPVNPLAHKVCAISLALLSSLVSALRINGNMEKDRSKAANARIPSSLCQSSRRCGFSEGSIDASLRAEDGKQYWALRP